MYRADTTSSPEDLNVLDGYLEDCGIETVAMESVNPARHIFKEGDKRQCIIMVTELGRKFGPRLVSTDLIEGS